MFEQAVLRPAPLRRWAVTVGFAGELALVGCVLAVPLVWPRLLPRREFLSWISAPTPPPRAIHEAPLPHVRPTRPWIRSDALIYPSRAIQQPFRAFDEPPVETAGVIGATGSGPSNTFGSIFDLLTRAEAPQRPVEVAPPASKSAPLPIQQVRVSGPVQEARLIRRVDPQYPALARQARVSGTVELAGVIGADGHIRELRVVAGHPLLVHAAVDAVRQWVYRPTLLGRDPVEVITTITVVFRLN